jgi:hypothetical protein
MNFSVTLKRWLKNKLFQRYQNVFNIVAILIFNCFLVLSKLTPALLKINSQDGVKYIESGRQLIIWGLRDLAWGPLVAFVYAPIDLFVGNSPNWFILEAWIGNVILYILLWLGFYYWGRILNDYVSEYVLLGLLFSSVVFFPIIENQSDALFLFFSMLASLKLYQFSKNADLKHIVSASLFVGLGVLSRVETVLLVVPLLVFSLAFNHKRNNTFKTLLASILPFIIIMSLFVGISMVSHSHPNLGMGAKSYDSFEMNEAFLPGSALERAYKSGEDIFGTAEDNQHSVINAIMRNPLAIGERALANVLKLPEMFLMFFGNLQGPIIFVFSLIGIYSLLQSKESELVILLFIWPLHAFVSLIFLSRHIIPQISFVFFVLAAVGISHFLSKREKRQLDWVILISTMILMVFSLIFKNKIILTSGLLIGLAAFFRLAIMSSKNKSMPLVHLPGMILLIGMLMYGSAFEFPARPVGKSEIELAIHQIQATLPSQSNVLIPTQTIAIASKTSPKGLPPSIHTIDGFFEFIIENDIKAIYQDANLPYRSDVVAAAIHQNPEHFKLIYESESDTIQVYLVENPEQRP